MTEIVVCEGTDFRILVSRTKMYARHITGHFICNSQFDHIDDFYTLPVQGVLNLAKEFGMQIEAMENKHPGNNL